jgi:predicted O-methyltransferase YrrM
MTPTFTADLFGTAGEDWTRHVVPVLAGVPDIRWLEVGSHEGRSSLWTLDHILTGKGSSITCVDVWAPRWLTPTGHEERFDANTKDRSNVVKMKGMSHAILPTLPKRSFHGAYIDGSHTERDAYLDACLVWPLLRPGAFLIFDDYEGNLPPSKPQQFGVRQAVDRFVAEHRDDLKILHKDWQVILRLKEAETCVCTTCIDTRALVSKGSV